MPVPLASDAENATIIDLQADIPPAPFLLVTGLWPPAPRPTCELFFVIPISNVISTRFRPRRRTPRSSTPVRSGSPRKSSRRICSAAIPRCRFPGKKVCRRNRLKWIQSSAAGLDHLLLPCVVESPIVVTNISGVLGNQVSEQAMALLLGLIRSLPTFFRATSERVHPPTGSRPARQHGGNRWIGWRWAAGRRGAERLQDEDSGHRSVSRG